MFYENVRRVEIGRFGSRRRGDTWRLDLAAGVIAASELQAGATKGVGADYQSHIMLCSANHHHRPGAEVERTFGVTRQPNIEQHINHTLQTLQTGFKHSQRIKAVPSSTSDLGYDLLFDVDCEIIMDDPSQYRTGGERK